MKKYLWIAVTADELELPIAVADSQSQLAEILGIKLDTLRRNFFLHQSGTYTEWKSTKSKKQNGKCKKQKCERNKKLSRMLQGN